MSAGTIRQISLQALLYSQFPMRLADFSEANIEPILQEWEEFARGIWPHGADTPVSPAEMRDHAAGILQGTVADTRSAQSGQQQADKSRGEARAAGELNGLTTSSTSHGADRMASGFEIDAVVAEYRPAGECAPAVAPE